MQKLKKLAQVINPRKRFLTLWRESKRMRKSEKVRARVRVSANSLRLSLSRDRAILRSCRARTYQSKFVTLSGIMSDAYSNCTTWCHDAMLMMEYWASAPATVELICIANQSRSRLFRGSWKIEVVGKTTLCAEKKTFKSLAHFSRLFFEPYVSTSIKDFMFSCKTIPFRQIFRNIFVVFSIKKNSFFSFL